MVTISFRRCDGDILSCSYKSNLIYPIYSIQNMFLLIADGSGSANVLRDSATVLIGSALREQDRVQSGVDVLRVSASVLLVHATVRLLSAKVLTTGGGSISGRVLLRISLSCLGLLSVVEGVEGVVVTLHCYFECILNLINQCNPLKVNRDYNWIISLRLSYSNSTMNHPTYEMIE